MTTRRRTSAFIRIRLVVLHTWARACLRSSHQHRLLVLIQCQNGFKDAAVVALALSALCCHAQRVRKRGGGGGGGREDGGAAASVLLVQESRVQLLRSKRFSARSWTGPRSNGVERRTKRRSRRNRPLQLLPGAKSRSKGQRTKKNATDVGTVACQLHCGLQHVQDDLHRRSSTQSAHLFLLLETEGEGVRGE